MDSHDLSAVRAHGPSAVPHADVDLEKPPETPQGAVTFDSLLRIDIAAHADKRVMRSQLRRNVD